MTKFAVIVNVFFLLTTRTFAFHYSSTFRTSKFLKEQVSSISCISSLILAFLILAFFPHSTTNYWINYIHIYNWVFTNFMFDSFILFIITHINTIIYYFLKVRIFPTFIHNIFFIK